VKREIDLTARILTPVCDNFATSFHKERRASFPRALNARPTIHLSHNNEVASQFEKEVEGGG
jgi:hypothetical protein